MSRRRDRWLSLGEVIGLLAERYPDLLKLEHPERRQKVRRIIRRAERRDGERYSKIDGRDLVVSRNALESLLPYDARTFSNLERSVAQNAQNHRHLRRQVNGLGARIGKVEKKQELADRYLVGLAELDASEPSHHRVTQSPLVRVEARAR